MSRVILGCVRVCVLGAPKTLRVFRKALHTIVRSTSSRPRTNSINLECLTLEWQDRAISILSAWPWDGRTVHYHT